jgi:uncharacterized protein YhaN
MDDKLKKDVEAVVAKIFSEKEETEIRKQTEEALSKAAATIEDLTVSLEAKNSEVSELTEQLSEAKEKATNLETDLEAVKEEIAEAKKHSAELESTLEEIEKDKATALRITELEEAGVISDKEAQSSKVREMTDEEFASYKDELAAVRAAIIAELSKSDETEEKEEADTEEKEEADTEEKEEKEEADTEEKEETEDADKEDAEEEEETPPANIDKNQAVEAALNLELAAADDIKNKYQKLGTAMADLLIKE